jgi:hypothetical protein
MALLGVGLPAAQAKPPCPLLTDPAGDAENLSEPIADDPSLDFISADITSDASRLTVVMRLVELRLPAPGSPTGALYEFGFRVDGVDYLLRAKYSPVTGEKFSLVTQDSSSLPVADVYVYSSTPVPVDGVFDTDLGEIRMTVALKDVPPGLRGGQVATAFRLVSWMEVEEWVMSADFIEQTGRSYRLGSPGCVAVGR